MLDIKRVLQSAQAPARGDLKSLSTPWGAALDPDAILAKHPRPTLRRRDFTMLNGAWDYAITVPDGALEPAPDARPHTEQEARDTVVRALRPETYEGTILVPFSPESALSGVGRIVQPNEFLWYRRLFHAPLFGTNERLVVHFEAVDWACAVYANGRLAATHIGGYLPFDVDITSCVESDAPVELRVCAFDPTDAGVQPRGKQRLDAEGIWYTPQSGIWQSVWYEVVPAVHLAALTLNGGADGWLAIGADISDPEGLLDTEAMLAITVREQSGAFAGRLELPLAGCVGDGAGTWRYSGTGRVDSPRLWSLDDPYLYDVEVTLHPGTGACREDSARSYCAFRTVEVARDDQGAARLHLNGEPLFVKGVLDQGYWSDGLMTAPSDDALVHDIETMKRLGFNMLRKHIKIECARWYYHCDRLGMLVWQDAVSGGDRYGAWQTSRKPTLFSSSWSRLRDDTPRGRKALAAGDARYREEWLASCLDMVRLLQGHPSIVTWVLFNEGWGQFDACAAAEAVHGLDPTRPIDATSGWYDQRCGDYLSHHNYFRPLEMARDTRKLQGYAAERDCRAFVLSEFGGWTQRVDGHAVTDSSYGYGNFATIEEWRDAVRATLAQADALEEQGLAGYVYTQLSDVESELNGLLTFDRRVCKLEDA